VRVVSPPHEVDRHGRGVAQRPVPAAVRVTSLVVRRSSLTPSAVSSEASVRDAAAWEMPRSIAASVKLPASAMATRQRSWRSSTLITKVYRSSTSYSEVQVRRTLMCIWHGR
jgi:uncharacterized protein YcbX